MNKAGIGDKVIVEVERDIVVPSGPTISGTHTIELVRDGQLIHHEVCENKIITEGVTLVLDMLKTGGSATNPWYVSIFDGDPGTPLTTWTYDYFYDGAQVPTTATEFSSYTEGVSGGGLSERPEWKNITTGLTTTNTVTKAWYDITAGGTIYGAMVCSEKTFGGDHNAADYALSISKFGTPVTVANGDDLKITVEITITPA